MARWRGRKVFTREAVMLMKRMVKEGHPHEVIAKELGTTPGSIAARCSQLNIRRERSPDEGYLGAKVGRACAAAFGEEAQKRSLLTNQLVGRILQQVASDNLFAAVLDV